MVLVGMDAIFIRMDGPPMVQGMAHGTTMELAGMVAIAGNPDLEARYSFQKLMYPLDKISILQSGKAETEV